MLKMPDKVDKGACAQMYALHANAEEVAETDLRNIVCDKLIVLQVRIRNVGRSWGDRHVGLATC
jgi:hypothetical protein